MLRILPNESCKLPPASVYYTGASNNLALWVARRASSAHVLVSQSQHDAGSSCCGDCEDLIALESWTYHRDATKCVCFSGEASEVEYLELSPYDDCLHITGDRNKEIFGYYGDDMIVITGDRNKDIFGGDGDDVITLTGDMNTDISGGHYDYGGFFPGYCDVHEYDYCEAYGEYGGDDIGADVITVTGNGNSFIYGGDGDDTIRIYGDDNTNIHGDCEDCFGDGDDTIIIYGDPSSIYSISGGDGHDSCSIVSSDGETTPVDDCEETAAVGS